MDDVSDAGRSPGTVERQGDHLLVTAPDAMPDRHWHRIELRLGASPARNTNHGDGRRRSAAVPVGEASQTRHELVEAWPASQWPWEWAPAATEAAETAEVLQEDLRKALSVEHDEASINLAAAGERVGLRRQLLPEQARAVARMVAMRSSANFSVPGSGKTTMTYAVFAHLRAAGLVDRMLVVAPLSAHSAWVDEARDCFTTDALPTVTVQPTRWPRSSDVIVLNYERAAASRTPAAAHRWAQGHRLLVVFDEAHRAKKGRIGLHGAAAAELASIGRCRIALTGTPMPNGERDLAVILDLVWPGFGEQLVYGNLKPRSERAWVRLTKDQLALSPMRLTSESVALDPAHRQVYDLVTAEFDELQASGLLDERPDLGRRAIMRMLAVASNPALILLSDQILSWTGDASTVVQTIRTDRELQDLVRQARPAKLQRVSEIALEHAQLHKKLLVWTNFLGNVTELSALLRDHHPAVITGATPVDDESVPTDRARELRRFHDDPNCNVLIATPQTLGEGVSLHRTCQSQVHLDRNYNAGLYLQSLDRTHRVGMPTGTHASAVALIARDTIDENVQASLDSKIAEMRVILSDSAIQPLALPNEDDDANHLGA